MAQLTLDYVLGMVSPLSHLWTALTSSTLILFVSLTPPPTMMSS